MEKEKILLVDDNESFLELFLSLSGAEAFNIQPLTSAKDALEVLKKEHVGAIIADVQMPEMTGIELFKIVQDLYPEIPFIMITAHGSTELAIQAVKQGAFHYFKKPVNSLSDLLWNTIQEALDKHKILNEITSLRKEKSLGFKTSSPMIGQSNEMKRIYQDIKEIAELPVTVLIRGETGTGKELVARSIHEQSDRKDNFFFAVNCNEFASGILESELFGHEKGAFTGALNQKKGFFEVADKGTLLLDEIIEAPLPLQSKLLRVLETNQFTRVGGTSPVYSDFRIITATNGDLEQAIADGKFREDLLYRINVYTINIPPLRERRDDVHLIAEHYVNHFSRKFRRPAQGISENALMALRSYDWPGNVRELVNVIERAVITCKKPMITTTDLPFETEDYLKISDLNLKDMERFYTELALKRTGGNKSGAARQLGISRKTLIEKLKKYGITDAT